jgi:alkylhydroperoxidase family enzyme
VSQEVIDLLPDEAARDGLTPEEQVTLRYAEQLTLDAKRVDDDLWDELRAHFDQAQIVELTAAAGLFNFFNRFNDALQIDITQPGWPGDHPPGE